MKLTQADYKKHDSKLQYKEDIYNDLAEYNKANGTTYEYFSEYVHNENEKGLSYVDISKPVNRSPNSVYRHLQRMGVHKKKPKGGARNIKLTVEQAAGIFLMSQKGIEPQEIADRYNVTTSAVSNIKNHRAWQSNEEFQKLIGRA